MNDIPSRYYNGAFRSAHQQLTTWTNAGSAPDNRTRPEIDANLLLDGGEGQLISIPPIGAG